MALLPLAVAANFLGIWLVRKTPTELFYQIAYRLMFLISLALLWQGWRSEYMEAIGRLVLGHSLFAGSLIC